MRPGEAQGAGHGLEPERQPSRGALEAPQGPGRSLSPLPPGRDGGHQSPGLRDSACTAPVLRLTEDREPSATSKMLRLVAPRHNIRVENPGTAGVGPSFQKLTPTRGPPGVTRCAPTLRALPLLCLAPALPAGSSWKSRLTIRSPQGASRLPSTESLVPAPKNSLSLPAQH